ncbi:hypothetical protein BJX76DRAFT_329056 [Aspergillus varians]
MAPCCGFTVEKLGRLSVSHMPGSFSSGLVLSRTSAEQPWSGVRPLPDDLSFKVVFSAAGRVVPVWSGLRISTCEALEVWSSFHEHPFVAAPRVRASSCVIGRNSSDSISVTPPFDLSGLEERLRAVKKETEPIAESNTGGNVPRLVGIVAGADPMSVDGG